MAANLGITNLADIIQDELEDPRQDCPLLGHNTRNTLVKPFKILADEDVSIYYKFIMLQ